MSTTIILIVGIYFGIFLLLLSIIYIIIEKPVIKRLQSEPQSSVRVILRNRIRRTRFIQYGFSSAYLTVGVIIAFTYSIAAGIIAMIFLMAEIMVTYKDLLVNISTTDYQLFRKKYTNKRYNLYLRGFATDNYLPYRLIDRPFKERFCELALRNTLKIYLNVDLIAVGMTKEIDSPLGAKRVYLDDDLWKQCVEEMIQKAESIYILMDDSDSCIWEILKTLNHLGKTVFIVDDIDKYNNIRIRTKGCIDFPKFDLPVNSIGIIKIINNKITLKIIVNTISNYQELLMM